MTGPRVSIIIPAYNRADVLPRAITSVLSQTFTDYEIIVVDDASTDETSAVARNFDGPVHVIRHEVNRGPAAARNTGIQATSGAYVAFLDSDDEWLPEKLARQIGLLDMSVKYFGASCSGYTVIQPELGYSWERRLPTEQHWTEYLLTRGLDLGPGSTLVARREVFERIGLLDEGLRRWEDWDWLLRYVAEYDLGVIPEPQAIIHLSSPSPSAALSASIPRFLDRWDGELTRLGPTRYRRLRARLCFELATALFHEGSRIRGLSSVARGLWSWPLQRPRTVLVFFDALFKTHLALRASRWRRRLRRPPGPST